MLIARTQEESDRFIECGMEDWTEEEINEVLTIVRGIKKRAHICFDLGEYKIVFKDKCFSISKEIYDFMKSDEKAFNYLSDVFLETIGENVHQKNNNEAILSRSDFLSDGYIDDLIKYGKSKQKEKGDNSLFALMSGTEITKPIPSRTKEYSILEMLEKEKEVLGVYLSGHPLDLYKKQIEKLLNNNSKTIKTKKYGSLAFFESIQELLDSKYNKGIIAVYCGSATKKQTKRTINTVVSLSTYSETYIFEDKEFGNGLYLNSTEGIEQHCGYLIIVERNRFALNGVQLIDFYKLKS